ncbi:MAG: hypothetical protein PHV88_02485 [Eubacteriales bacterium]|nr:hypothetical protein [Eubacteriales bacterium]
MQDNKIYCVISHTHWDREWYMPFEEFRIRLVELMDRLFVILEKNPEYIFHLDAQTIVLEDYLEIRPHKRALIERYVKSGNILIGPWYLQNDFYLTSGEATIRNLLIGKQVAESFGACTKVGYAPDQFGNISQLPQILSQFDIDNFIFGRGYGKYFRNSDGSPTRDDQGKAVREKTPSEFIWEGADGTRLLAIHMKYWYNNAQRIYADTENALKLLSTIENLFDGYATTPYLLLMNGVDHLEAQDDLLPVLKDIQERLSDGRKIAQMNMADYITSVRQWTESSGKNLIVHKGELRDGHDWELLKGTLSSRVYLKQQNVRTQADLESRLEPLSAMYEIAGASGTYDKDHLDHIWKSLLKTHPHDSICGCSRDEVHDHMEDLYERIGEASSYLIQKKSMDILTHSEIYDWSDDGDVICIINGQSDKWTGILKGQAMFLASEEVKGFRLETADGVSVRFSVTDVTDRRHDVFTALNLPGILDVRVYDILIKDPGTNGYSVKGLKVIRQESFDEGVVCVGNDFEKLEDENAEITTGDMKIVISSEGKINVKYLAEELTVVNAIRIEEEADLGDAYVFLPLNDRIRYADEYPASVEVMDIPGFRRSVRILYDMELPSGYDHPTRARTKETVRCPVSVTLSADYGNDLLEIDVGFENNADNHRMRLLIDTGLKSRMSFGDIPFDIVDHDIEPDYPDTKSPVHANTSVAGIESNIGGTAVFTTGNHEYEHLLNKPGTLAFTLVRGNPCITVGDNGTSYAGPKWDVPGNQCKRFITARFALISYTGDRSGLPSRSAQFRTPPEVVFGSCDRKKFAGGRFAIQGSDNAEFYYLPDLHPEVRIKDNEPLVSVEGEGILVTALKMTEDRKNFALRLVNLSQSRSEVKISYKDEIKRSGLDETCSDDPGSGLKTGDREFDLKAKEILTVLLSK